MVQMHILGPYAPISVEKNYKNIAASAPMRELGHAHTLRIGALKLIFLGKKWFKCTF